MPPLKKKKTSQLSDAGALDGTELVRIAKAGLNKKTTTQEIADLGAGGGGFPNPLTGNFTWDLNGFFLNFVDVPGTLSLEISPGANLIQLLSGLASGLRLDGAIGRTAIGDSAGAGNSTNIVIDDTTGTIVGNVGGVEHSLIPTVKVVAVHTSGSANVGTSETVLDEHILQAGILVNDGESLYGSFIFSWIASPSGLNIRRKIILINNGVTFDLFNSLSTSNTQARSLMIFFDIMRINANTVKAFVRFNVPVGSGGNDDNVFTNISGLDLSLPITLQLTGTVTGTGADSGIVTGEFSKIFKSAAV